MSHPAQPSFVWQLYHYDLEPNSSLYGAKKAAEHIHVQLNESNGGVEVVNNSPGQLDGYKIRTTIYALDGAVSSQNVHEVNGIPGSRTIKIFQLAANPHISAVYFVKLDLLTSNGVVVSTNFYWQNVAQDDFTLLANMPPVELEANAITTAREDTTVITVTLHNPTSHIALMTHLQLRREGTDERVLPVFYSDNYISLAPDETREFTVEARTSDFKGNEPWLALDGFNTHVKASGGQVLIKNNKNADPMNWPASSLVTASQQ
jgi:mannosylglycoprotein endo-beta-mannosidase